MFGKKLRRAMEAMRARKKDEEPIREDQEIPLEKGELPAMVFSALVTILPACLLALLLISGVGYLFFALMR